MADARAPVPMAAKPNRGDPMANNDPAPPMAPAAPGEPMAGKV